MSSMFSFSTNPLTNDTCMSWNGCSGLVCEKCYAIRKAKFREGLTVKLEQNSQIFSKKKITRKDIPILNLKYLRINSFGEVINKKHADNIYTICRLNPGVLVTVYTKRPDLFDLSKKPQNLQLIYSNPIMNPKTWKIPAGFDKIFNVFDSKTIKERKIKVNCMKKCIECLKCYTKNKTRIINEKVK